MRSEQCDWVSGHCNATWRTRPNNVVCSSDTQPSHKEAVSLIITSPVCPITHENMTSSIKPEVHNVLHRRQKMTEPRPRITRTEIQWSSDVWSLSYASGQTDIQTRSSPYFAPVPGREVITSVWPVCTGQLPVLLRSSPAPEPGCQQQWQWRRSAVYLQTWR